MAATTLQTSAFPVSRPIAQVSGQATEDTPFQRIGFRFLLVFIFLAFSRIFDVKFSYFHITGITYRGMFAMVILSRSFVTAINTKTGHAMLGFTFFFGLSVPFSMWRGGSLPIFLDGWLLFSFVAFLAVGGLIANYDQCKRAINALAWALMVFVLIVNVYGTMETGRLFLPQGKFANPNEMAQALLVGMPLWAAKMTETRAGPKKLFAAGVMFVMLVTVFRTGSRGAMIGFVVMAALMFARASVMGKAQMLLAIVLLTGFVMVAMPGRLISRYKTIAEDTDDEDEMDPSMRESALSSTESRKQLLKNSIKFTIRHPLFGVGAGNFPVADNAEAIANGLRKGQWLGTHNSYTQVSSELGIPAFCFFVAAIFLSLKGPYVLYRQTRGDPRTADMAGVALGLHYAMILYAVTILFEHIAYTVMLPVFAGLASSLVRVSEAEIARRRSAPVAQTLTAPVFRTYSPTVPSPTA